MNVFKEDLLNTIREAILVLDSDLTIVYANSSFYKQFKVTPAETQNKHIYELGNGQWDIPELRKLLEEILPNQNFFYDFKVRHIFPDIGQKNMLINAAQLIDGGRNEKFIVVAIEDSTEKAKLYEASLLANKLATMGQLSAGIAHGLSSPLTGIHNFLDVYAKEEPKESDRHHELELMLAACDYMNKIVKNLTYFARTIKEEFKIINWRDVVDSTLSFTERQFMVSNIMIKKDLPADLKNMIGNKSQLQHVLLNILMNAKEAITNSGEITIKAQNSDKDKRVMLEITDNGKGIPAKDLQHIFEPFFSTKDQSGAGLGLSAAYGIIKDHFGEINVRSEEGKGTCLTISLPYTK